VRDLKDFLSIEDCVFSFLGLNITMESKLYINEFCNLVFYSDFPFGPHLLHFYVNRCCAQFCSVFSGCAASYGFCKYSSFEVKLHFAAAFGLIIVWPRRA